MATLMESLTNLIAPATGQIAAKLGESEAAISGGVTSSLGSVLGGLLNKTRDPAAFGNIFDVISSAPPSANLNADMESAVGGLGASGSGPTNTATNFLGMLFGGGLTGVTELLGRSGGFKNPASAASLLAFAAPMVLNFFGKKVHDDGLDASKVSNLLTSERESIVAAAPPGFMDVVESAKPPLVEERVVEERVVEEREVPIAATPGDRPYVDEAQTERSGRWLWPAVGIAAVLLAWIAISVSRPHRVAQRTASIPAVDTMMARPGGMVDTAGGEVAAPISPLGALGMHRLPNGLVINVPAYGMETRVIGFIEGTQPVTELTSFDFDRLKFSPGSPHLLPASQEQINTVASILRAYPKVSVKVEGFSDNAGSPVTNLKLSQERANTVKQALVGAGIKSSRIKAVGGGPRNQRVVLDITSK